MLESVGPETVKLVHPVLGAYYASSDTKGRMLFCENRTNTALLYGDDTAQGPFKDAFHDYVVLGRKDAVAKRNEGTKACFHSVHELEAGASATARLRLTGAPPNEPFAEFDSLFEKRAREADAFYEAMQTGIVQRQAFAGMLCSKQFYYWDVPQWLDGDPQQPPPPQAHRTLRNTEWRHLNNADIISMPDKWEYPWYASWDLAFQCLPLALVDPSFAKQQLLLLVREWYMHPNGQLPAYEWNLSDVNPPVQAWAAWRVYEIDRDRSGRPDRAFLERVFHKMLLARPCGAGVALGRLGRRRAAAPVDAAGTPHEAAAVPDA